MTAKQGKRRWLRERGAGLGRLASSMEGSRKSAEQIQNPKAVHQSKTPFGNLWRKQPVWRHRPDGTPDRKQLSPSSVRAHTWVNTKNPATLEGPASRSKPVSGVVET